MVSISRNEGIRLTCFDSIGEGKKILFKFNFGSIDHPVFGQSQNLCGEFELFNSNGSYPISSYFHLTKDKQDDLLESNVKKFRKMFEHLTEEDMRKWIGLMLITTALCCPGIEAESKLFEIISDQLCVGFQVDDILEDQPAFRDIGFYYKVMANDDKNLIQKSKTQWEILFTRFAKFAHETGHVPLVMYAENHFAAVESEKVEGVKEWIKLTKQMVEAIAVRQTTIQNNLTLSEATWDFIRAYDSAIGVFQELCCAVRRFIVRKDIRKTILFQLFLKRLRDFGAQLNDIVGLQKDMSSTENPPNVILRRVLNEGILIDESFRQVLNLLLETIKDLKVVGKLLREAFPDDRNLSGYIEASFDMCDGQTLSYLVSSQLNSRYGSIKMELVQA